MTARVTELHAPATVSGSADARSTARAARGSILILTDAAALMLAAAAAYMLWAMPIKHQSLGLYVDTAPLMLVFVFGYAQAGLYPGLGLGPVETLRRQTLATTFGFLVLAAFSFALKVAPLYSRVTFSIAFGLSLVIVPIARAVLVHTACRWSWWSEPVVVIGTWGRAAGVIASMRRASLGYRPVAVLTVGTQGNGPAADLDDVPVVGGLDDAEAVAATGIRVALVETRRSDPARERPLIDRLQRHFRHVVLLRGYDDLPVEGLQVRNLGSLVGIEYTNNLLRESNQAVKRTVDVMVGTIALVLAAPIVAVAALLVRILDGSPSFFVQNRAGQDGRRISVPKIRTMRRGAQEQLDAHLSANPEARQEWESTYKLKDDPRLIPVVGRFFRHYSIDELPQLWTVLRGDMSLVGPRPFPDYHLQNFSPDFLDLRLRVPPGVTGLWQITIRSAGSTRDQESYDSYYIRNWSVWLDLYVLSRTIAAIVSGRGAY